MFPNPVLPMEVNVHKPVFDQLSTLLDGVFEHIWRSPDQFSALFPATPLPPPMPFLGEVHRARILTVGVKPGEDIIAGGRYPERISSPELTRQLLDYFKSNPPGLDYELGTWECVLNTLDCSYLDGSAAHIYISPRALQPLAASEHYLFKEMCRYDAPALFRLLAMLRKPRVLLMAGDVTPGRPVNAFLREVAVEQRWRLLGEGQGQECFAYHSLMSDEACYDGFHAQACPGEAGGRERLVSGIQEQAQVIGLLTAGTGGPVEIC